jgi:hypothetical protein
MVADDFLDPLGDLNGCNPYLFGSLSKPKKCTCFTCALPVCLRALTVMQRPGRKMTPEKVTK